jgi:DNA end-binding protein Ku
MARSIWNGTIAFGLVQVPVKVYSATESKTIHFHEVHARDGGRIEHRRICPNDGEEVPYDEIVKGYEVAKGEYVELTDEEIEAAAGRPSRLVDVDHFVPADDVDPVFYDRSYYLGARDGGDDAYALLRAALKRSRRAAIGRWVFHNRERAVMIRTVRGVLAMHTMRFADELVDGHELELGRVHRNPSEREIEMAASLIEGLHTDFDPSQYEDTYRTAVLELIERKAAGETIEPRVEAPPGPPDDLLAALEASVKGDAGKPRAKARA